MRNSARFGVAAALLACALAAPAVAAVDYPPGLDADGVTDADALLDAHADALRNASYAFDYRYVRRAPDGTVVERVRTRAQVAADGRFNSTHRESGSGARDGGPATDTYANDSAVYTAIRQNGSVAYARAPPSKRATARERFLGTWFVRRLLNRTDAAVERVERNGTTVYAVETPAPTTASFGEYDLTNLSVRAVVSRTGVVREFRATYERGGDSVVLRRSYADVGRTEVERPAWLAEAVGNATREGGGVVERPAALLLGYGGLTVGLLLSGAGALLGERRLLGVGLAGLVLGAVGLALG